MQERIEVYLGRRQNMIANKRNLLTIVAFILAIPASAASEPLKNSPCEKIDPNLSGEDIEISRDQAFSAKDLCLYHRVKKTGVLKNCDKINDTDVNEKCVLSVALRNKNYKLCAKVKKQTGKKQYQHAYNRDECIRWYAYKTTDSEICKKMRSEDSRNKVVFFLKNHRSPLVKSGVAGQGRPSGGKLGSITTPLYHIVA